MPQLLANQAVSYLIASNGDVALAAVAASEELGHQVSEAQVLLAIASDISSLAILGQQVKLLMLIQTLDAFRLTHMAYVSKIPDLSPKDTAAAYSRIIQDIAALTAGAPLKMPDPMSTILASLPQPVRESVEFFLKNPPSPDQPSSPASHTLPLTPAAPTPGVLNGARPAASELEPGPLNRAGKADTDPLELEAAMHSLSERLEARDGAAE